MCPAVSTDRSAMRTPLPITLPVLTLTTATVALYAGSRANASNLWMSRSCRPTPGGSNRSRPPLMPEPAIPQNAHTNRTSSTSTPAAPFVPPTREPAVSILYRA